jgi:hypothetical protein
MEIVLHSKGQDYTVLIDEEDFHRVSKYNWHISHYQSNRKYCITNIITDGKRTTLKLHRFLLGLEKGDKRIINHIDGDGLNNKKSNLEICDAMYNSQSINTKRNFGCISIEKNIEKKYKPQVNINKKKYSKRFYTKEEAQAYLDGLYEIAKIETIPFS